MAQLVGVSACNPQVAGSIPSQGTCLGCGFDPSLRVRVTPRLDVLISSPAAYGRQPVDASLSH